MAIVVNSNYDIYGGRKEAHCANGWYVAVAINTTSHIGYIYYSTDKRKTWAQLAYFSGSVVSGATITCIGNKVTIVFSAGSTYSITFDVTTVTNIDLSSTKVLVDSTSGAVDIDMKNDGTNLYCAFSVKSNSNIPWFYNIRFSKSINGGASWVTTSDLNTGIADSSQHGYRYPNIIFYNGSPIIICMYTTSSGGSIYYIKYTGTQWSSPVGVISVNSSSLWAFIIGSRIWIIYNHMPASGNYEIRYICSDDGCATWSSPQTIVNDWTIALSPTVAIQGNSFWIFWRGSKSGLYSGCQQIRYIKYDGTQFATPVTLTSNSSYDQISPQCIDTVYDNMVSYIWNTGVSINSDSIILWTPPNIKSKIDGALKTYSDGWIKVDGVLRHIDSMWAKIDGTLKKL